MRTQVNERMARFMRAAILFSTIGFSCIASGQPTQAHAIAMRKVQIPGELISVDEQAKRIRFKGKDGLLVEWPLPANASSKFVRSLEPGGHFIAEITVLKPRSLIGQSFAYNTIPQQTTTDTAMTQSRAIPRSRDYVIVAVADIDYNAWCSCQGAPPSPSPSCTGACIGKCGEGYRCRQVPSESYGFNCACTTK